MATLDDDAPLSSLASAKFDDDTPLSFLAAAPKAAKAGGKGGGKAAPSRAGAKAGAGKAKSTALVVKRKRGDDESSSNSDSSSSDSDSSSEEGGGGAPKKKKITQGKRLASFKKKQSSGDVTADKGEEEDTEQYVVNTRVRTPKMQAVADLLCRWWYVLPDWPPQDQAFYQPELEKRKLRQVTITEWEWVPEEDSHGRRKVYELSQFRGLFRDSTGNLHDLRPQETCPCFANMMKKELPDILDLLVTAYENQLKDLEKSTYNEEKLKKDLLVKLTRLKNKSYQAKQVGSAKGR